MISGADTSFLRLELGAGEVGYLHWVQNVRGVLGLSAPEKSRFTVILRKIKVMQKNL